MDSELRQGEGCVEPHSGARETTVSMQDRSKPTSENLKRLDAAWQRGCRDEDYATDDEMSTTPMTMMMKIMTTMIRARNAQHGINPKVSASQLRLHIASV